MKKIQTTTFYLSRALVEFLFCKRSFCILVFYLFILNVYNQNLPASTQKRIDSLKTVLQSAKEDTNQIKILFEISSIYVWTTFRDSSIKYANLIIRKTDKFKCNPYWKGFALNILGIVYSGSNPPEGLKYYFEALKLRRQIQDKRGMPAQYFSYLLLQPRLL